MPCIDLYTTMLEHRADGVMVGGSTAVLQTQLSDGSLNLPDDELLLVD